MKYCPFCGTPLMDEATFCTKCGRKIDTANGNESSEKGSNHTPDSKSFINRVYDYLGSDKEVKVNWQLLFSNVTKPHTTEEAELLFSCGTKETTPDPSTISTDFPRPWLYARVFLGLIITFILLWICCSAFSNSNALPGLIIVGSFMVPLSTMILFFEMNVWRNISFYKVLITFFIGGCASLVATLILFSIIPVEVETSYTKAFFIGLIEEVGKAVIVFYAIRKTKNPSLLNGLLIGSCVGAGFAAFESAGYAFNYWECAGFDAMMHTIYLRGFLAPGGHVAWAAITGAAIVIARKKSNSNTIS